jgi:glycosyltransferase involved in cell wall biosynthesis
MSSVTRRLTLLLGFFLVLYAAVQVVMWQCKWSHHIVNKNTRTAPQHPHQSLNPRHATTTPAVHKNTHTAPQHPHQSGHQSLNPRHATATHQSGHQSLNPRHATTTPAVHTRYISPNAILERTVLVIKTYNRVQCLVTLLDSVAKHCPWIHIIVADDSGKSAQDKVDNIMGLLHKPIYMRLPIDSGVGYGRQRLVEKAHALGFEYLIMSDDDFVIPSGDLIPRLAQTLLDLNADVLSPLRCEVKVTDQMITGEHAWNGNFDSGKNCGRGEVAAVIRSPKNELIVLPKVTFPYADDTNSIHPVLRSSLPRQGSIGAKFDCHRSDLVQQFFLAKVDKLLKSGWDDVLKNNDHYDAMLSMKQQKMRLFVCRKLKISHNSLGCTRHDEGTKYLRVRKSRWMDLMPYVLKKWNASALYDEVGRRWSVSSNGDVQTQCGRLCNKFPPIKTINMKSHIFGQALRAAQTDINAQRPSWDNVALFTNDMAETSVKVKNVGPCMSQIETVVKPEWAVRPKTKKTDAMKSLSTKSLVLHSCDSMHTIMRYLPVRSMLSKIRLYYVMVISSSKFDISTILTDLSKNGGDDAGTLSVGLVLVVMNNDDDEVAEAQWKELIQSELNKKPNSIVKLHVVTTAPPFGRSIGLKIGYEYIRTALEPLDQSQKSSVYGHDVVVFSLDASLRLPLQFSQQIIKSTRCGVVAYAPICKKNSMWVEGAYGMVGMCLSDYIGLEHGWREKWWYRWGAEDIDMITQVQKNLIVLRPRINEYLHVAKKNSREKNPIYYNKKNLYPDFLPVVPVSEIVEDASMVEQVWSSIREHRPQATNFEPDVWRTEMRPMDKLVIFSTWEIDTRILHLVSMARPEAPTYEQPTWRKQKEGG